MVEKEKQAQNEPYEALRKKHSVCPTLNNCRSLTCDCTYLYIIYQAELNNCSVRKCYL